MVARQFTELALPMTLADKQLPIAHQIHFLAAQLQQREPRGSETTVFGRGHPYSIVTTIIPGCYCATRSKKIALACMEQQRLEHPKFAGIWI